MVYNDEYVEQMEKVIADLRSGMKELNEQNKSLCAVLDTAKAETKRLAAAQETVRALTEENAHLRAELDTIKAENKALREKAETPAALQSGQAFGEQFTTFYELTDAELEALSPKRETKPAPSPETDFEIAEENGKTVLKKYRGNAKNVVIPDGVTSIGKEAFKNCKSLISVIIPDGVTSISKKAFKSCKSLISVIILDGVTSISEEAFRNCKSLTSITIPESVKNIGWGAFYYCLLRFAHKY